MVGVGPADQLVDLLVRNVFSQLLCDPPQILSRDEASPLVVEKIEDFVNVGASIFVVDTFGQEGEPLCKIDASISVSVEVRDHLEDGRALGLESQ